MALKERALELNADGAKCGIDYDPTAPGRHAALRRFLRFLKPHLGTRLSRFLRFLKPHLGTRLSLGRTWAYAAEADISPATATTDLRRLVDADLITQWGHTRSTAYVTSQTLRRHARSLRRSDVVTDRADALSRQAGRPPG